MFPMTSVFGGSPADIITAYHVQRYEPVDIEIWETLDIIPATGQLYYSNN